MIRAVITVAFAFVLVALAGEARAEYRLCNETSYIMNSAIGVQSGNAVVTRGWFELLPGRCTVVVEGALDADRYFFYSEAPNFYDDAVTRFDSGVRLCVGSGQFLIENATECENQANQLRRFIEVQPKSEGDDWQLDIAEEAEFDLERAGLAGVQRLLGMLGYQAGRIDGIAGDQTNEALSTFFEAAGISPDENSGAEVYRALIAELKAKQAGVGLQICNETRHLVWTALGIPEGSELISRGWYRIGTGECVRPYKKPLDGSVIYSFGEAVDEDGPIISADNIPLIWDGDTLLCTQSTRFNINDHENCEAKGMTPTRFRRIDLGGARSWTIRYTEPR